MKTIGVLTGGGDAPGLNAVIRAVVKTAETKYGWRVLGIRDGFEGLLSTDGIFPLDNESIRGILPLGGTILGTANRGNPFAKEVIKDGKTVYEDVSMQVVERIRSLDLFALIVIGGDGTMRIAMDMSQLGVSLVGVPKTIDNDILGTDCTFGFDTAVNIATEALDRLHTTAEAHHRVMILELMGRDAGFIALHAGVAGGADIILIPEIPFYFESICNKVKERIESGRKFSIISVAEGATNVGGEQIFDHAGDDDFVKRLGGIGTVVSKYVQNICGAETRVTVLGHLQRGGSPTAFDRWLATRFGAAAVRLAATEQFGQMVSLRGTQITHLPLEDALSKPKRVDITGDAVLSAREMKISFGDEM